jgi:RNA polymerase sigma-70 factor (ECF subfamily)
MDGYLTPIDFGELTDDELVELAKKRGDRDDRPFRILMERHQTTVWRVCYNFLKNSDDAEDLTQEVFLRAYRNLKKFEGRSSFKTWVYRIAINTSRNEIRHRARRPQESPTPLETAAEFIPSSQNVEEITHKRARSKMLAEALKQLEPSEFKVLLLKDVEGRPYAEIANELDISLSAAKMRVQRARASLKITYNKMAQAE